MTEKIYGRKDWEVFRGDVIDLIVLYKHIKEFALFDLEKIEYIQGFFFHSKKNAITSFYIKLGFLMSNGKPTFKNFLSADDYKELFDTYKIKLRDMRDKVFAHNVKTQLPSDFLVYDEDVDLLYSKIIFAVKKLDDQYEDKFDYQYVGDFDGVKCLESYIQDSIELDTLEKSLVENGYKGTVELDIRTGKINLTS